MKREVFEAGGLRIETARDWNGRWFVCWKPNVSVLCRGRRSVLQFAAWPVKTPTGDRLREWLSEVEARDAARKEQAVEKSVGDAHVEGSFDPLAHDVDNANTRTVI